MQKKLKSLLMVASFVVAATLVFVACGEGKIMEILQADMEDSEGHAKEHYSSVLAELPYIPTQSSSAEPPPPPSSAYEPASSTSPITPSSTSPITPSSTSPTQSSTGGTSSAAPVPKSSSTPSQTTSGCKENNPKAGFTCSWNGYTAGSVLTPGTTLKPASYTLPGGCTSVAWKFAPDTTGMVMNYMCETTDENGFLSVGSQNYVLFAELTCDDGKHTTACNPKTGWSSKRAPALTGTCKWDRSPAVTTSAKGAKPSGVSYEDPDKVCSSPSVVYKYADGTKDWPSTGLLSEWGSGVWKTDKKHKETYSDVTPTLNCPAYSQTITADVCPALEVSAGADYQITCNGGQFSSCNELKDVKDDECADIEINWTDQYNTPTVKFACQVKGSSDGKITINVGGKGTSGNHYLPVDIGKIAGVGKLEVTGVCVRLPSGGTADCKLTQ